ncbi:MAG: glycerol-3-phosphate cytidylyltransferase [Ruminococcaceae bacterium]|nr:glycerol-3-phosphate cytidylyltransferase [Oscillospiraceae bacterium]MBQ3214895.1 Gfo/Idh/MocA family oxidoreductase [Oscillospiraceae bacterium]
MKKVITYGTYDLLHHGHVALLKRAKALGDYLIVGVTADGFDKERGKLNVSQSLAERIENVRQTGIADQIIVEEYEGQKISDIEKYGVDIFTVGSDWVGKFDYLSEYCQVVYLPRTRGISSTVLRASAKPVLKLGILGVDSVAERFYTACKAVSGIEAHAVFDADPQRLNKFCRGKSTLERRESAEDIYEGCDAVFINTPANEHYEQIIAAIKAGCHVICNPPIFLSVAQAEECYRLADEAGLELFEGIKTLYFPAFEHMLLLIKSGLIGTVKDIDVSCSQIPEQMEQVSKNKYMGSLYDWGPIALLPIIKMYESQCESSELISFQKEEFSYFTRGFLRYPNATASIRVGKGMKVEGELVITGTKGYLYVPAPWWLTEYFEIRSEDLRQVKKYYFNYEGDGFRYMIYNFLHSIHAPERTSVQHTRQEILRATTLMEKFHKGDCKVLEL